MHFPQSIYLVDKQTTIHLVNRELEQITGYDRLELEGQRKWSELVLSEDRDILKNLLRMLKANSTGSPHKYECRFIDRHGSLKTAFMTGETVKDSGLVILSLINITELKENENILKNAKSKAEASERSCSVSGTGSHQHKALRAHYP